MGTGRERWDDRYPVGDGPEVNHVHLESNQHPLKKILALSTHIVHELVGLLHMSRHVI